jgi:hypothetical protein
MNIYAASRLRPAGSVVADDGFASAKQTVLPAGVAL